MILLRARFFFANEHQRAAAFSFLPLFLPFPSLNQAAVGRICFFYIHISAEKNEQRWSLRSDSHQRLKNEFAIANILSQVNALSLAHHLISQRSQPIKFTFVLIGSWFCVRRLIIITSRRAERRFVYLISFVDACVCFDRSAQPKNNKTDLILYCWKTTPWEQKLFLMNCVSAAVPI